MVMNNIGGKNYSFSVDSTAYECNLSEFVKITAIHSYLDMNTVDFIVIKTDIPYIEQPISNLFPSKEEYLRDKKDVLDYHFKNGDTVYYLLYNRATFSHEVKKGIIGSISATYVSIHLNKNVYQSVPKIHVFDSVKEVVKYINKIVRQHKKVITTLKGV